MYRVDYWLGQAKIETFRSFTEFSALYQELKANFKGVVFPCFPPKRPASSFSPPRPFP